MKNMIKPFVVLVVICLIAGSLLALTNYITEPIISENAEKAAAETRLAVLPDAKEFSKIESLDADEINSIHKGVDGDGNTVGYVVSVTRKGYKSVSVTVGLDAEGKIVGMSVDASKETSGIGSKVALDEYVSKFIGLHDNADDVDIIAQATYSSSAVKACVNAALEAFSEIGGNEG